MPKSDFTAQHEHLLFHLLSLQHKPAPFTPGEPLFWDDPHISSQMLKAHLDPTTDLASRKSETIDLSTAWIMAALVLQPGDAVLDLGCGPGLYALRLARLGLQVTGVDASCRSISYAREAAAQEGLAIDYRNQDYLTLEDEDRYDAALLIFGDYCTFKPEDRQQILANVRRALKPGGHFVFDVSTREHRMRHGAQNGWYASEGGFWLPDPHLVLEQGFDYPEDAIYLDQYIVIGSDGTLTVYRNWFQDFTPKAITTELLAAGFTVEGCYADLTGKLWDEGSEWVGLIACPVSNS